MVIMSGKTGPLALESAKITQLLKEMKKSHLKDQGMCGLDKIWEDVKIAFPKCSRKRVYRLQRLHGLYSVRKRKPKVMTTDSNHKFPIAKNLLNQNFDVHQANSVWVTDITQFNTQNGEAYLAIVKDIYTKEIVGWALGNHMRTQLCIDALENAVRKHRPGKGLTHHSDRGSQYCSNEYQSKLKEYKMVCSMSRKGNCWDNACAETFFSALKSERIQHRVYKNLSSARKDLFWYIEYFYNRRRRHQSLGNIRIPEFKRVSESIAA